MRGISNESVQEMTISNWSCLSKSSPLLRTEYGSSENLCHFVEAFIEKSILFLQYSYKGFFIMALLFTGMKINICVKTRFLFFYNYW